MKEATPQELSESYGGAQARMQEYSALMVQLTSLHLDLSFQGEHLKQGAISQLRAFSRRHRGEDFKATTPEEGTRKALVLKINDFNVEGTEAELLSSLLDMSIVGQTEPMDINCQIEYSADKTPDGNPQVLKIRLENRKRETQIGVIIGDKDHPDNFFGYYQKGPTGIHITVMEALQGEPGFVNRLGAVGKLIALLSILDKAEYIPPAFKGLTFDEVEEVVKSLQAEASRDHQGLGRGELLTLTLEVLADKYGFPFKDSAVGRILDFDSPQVKGLSDQVVGLNLPVFRLV